MSDADDSKTKIPRLFYWEEAVDAFVPAPDHVSSLVDVFNLDADFNHEVVFKRIDMTDEEYANLPEG